MELPEASADVARRMNVSYGVESSDPQIVYEAIGTGENLARALSNLEKLDQRKPQETNLDHLLKATKDSNDLRELFTVPPQFATAQDQLDSIGGQLSALEAEFAEVCDGKENLIRLAINSSEKDLTPAELEELKNRSEAELARIFDDRDMAELLKSCRAQFNTLKEDPIYQRLPALSQNTQIICTGLEGLRKKLAALKAGETIILEEPPRASPTIADVDVVNLGCRLTELERIVGIGAASRLKYSFTDLPTALCQVTHQLMLLDPKRVDAINERTAALADEHDRLAGVLAGYGEFEKKIELLYANMSKWISLSRSLPRIIRKLECCANLGREVSTIDGRINTIESQMTSLEALLRDSNTQLQNLTEMCSKYLHALNAVASDDATF